MKLYAKLRFPSPEVANADADEGEEQAKVENEPSSGTPESTGAGTSEQAAAAEKTEASAEAHQSAQETESKEGGAVDEALGPEKTGNEKIEGHREYVGAFDKLRDGIDELRQQAVDAMSRALENGEKMNKIENSDGKELLSLFRKGDAMLLDALSDPTYGPALLMKIQDALNTENRMFSLRSNMLAIEHETKKAIIGNLR